MMVVSIKLEVSLTPRLDVEGYLSDDAVGPGLGLSLQSPMA